MNTRTPHLPLPFGDRRAAPPDGTSASPGSSPWSRAGRAAWGVLQDMGQRRSRRHLQHLARDIEASRPELAAQLRDAARRSWL